MHVSELNKFDTFSDLDEQSKLIASSKVHTFVVSKSELLFDIGDVDTEEFFLVSGEIELIASDKKRKRIRADEPMARFPLALLRPRKFSATVISETATLFKIDVDTLKQIKKSVPVAGDAFSSFSVVEEVDYVDASTEMDDVKNFLISASDAVSQNRLNINNFDTVSTTIFNVITDPDVSLDMLASAVQLDPVASAKIIKAANSAFFAGLEKVDSVRAAVVRLGLDLSVQLVTVMVMKEVFSSKSESLHDSMTNLWQSSIKLATYSVVVGKKSIGHFQQGQTLLAGLMSDIGAMVIIAFLDQYPNRLQALSHEVMASKPIKRKLANDLLTHWDFPENIIEVISASENYEREVEQADLSDVVMIARLLIRQSAYRKLPVDSINLLPAYQRLGFDPEDHQIIETLAAEAQRYAELFTAAGN